MTSPPPSKHQKVIKVKKEKKSTQLYKQLKQEGPRKPDTGRFVDRDDRLPEQANELNLWANTYWAAGCRTWDEVLADKSRALSSSHILENPENPTLPPHPSTPHTRSQIHINVTYTHNHIISSSPYSKKSAGDVSASVSTIKKFNIPGLSPRKPLPPVAEREEGKGASESSESSKIVFIPALNLRCMVADIHAPPALSYTTDNIKELIRD